MKRSENNERKLNVISNIYEKLPCKFNIEIYFIYLLVIKK